MIEFKDIIRKPKTNEYYLNKELVFKLIPHEEYKKMFWVEFIDGNRSKDFYNKTRAAAYGRQMFMSIYNMMEDTAKTLPK